MNDDVTYRYTLRHGVLGLLGLAIAAVGYVFVSPAWVAELFYACCGGLLFISTVNVANHVAVDLYAPLSTRWIPIACMLAIGLACGVCAVWVARACAVDVRLMYATHVVPAPQRYLLQFAVAAVSAALAVLLAGGGRRDGR